MCVCVYYRTEKNSAWHSNLLKMKPVPRFARSDVLKSSKLLFL